jgi:hypothetical protein
VNEVPTAHASLNTGDVFILDKGLTLFLYNGAQANRYEKAKGVEVIQKIKGQERGGRANVVIIDEDPHNAEFWGALGGERPVTNAGEDDEAHDSRAAGALQLFRISDASGAVEFTPVTHGGRLTRDLLDTNDVFLVDSGNEVYVWVGKGATANEKREGMLRATAYLQQSGRPANTPCTRVSQGTESSVFKALFHQWDPPATPQSFTQTSRGVAKAQTQQAIDIAGLHARKEAEEASVDDGSGRVELWRIENFAKAPVDRSKYGQFFGGDSYILLYTYVKNRQEEHIIYFWQGRESSQDEKGASALLAKELDDSMGGRPVQVRVVQGKEPAHFRSIFRGRMIVHSGGHASGFKNREDKDSYDADGVGLFHVKGTNPNNTYGIQVREHSSSLNSGDCFVLVTPSHAYVWKGAGANETELATARSIAQILANDYNGSGGRAVTVVQEHSEPEDFWARLGGRGEYAQHREGEIWPSEPRLFQCSNATGVFRVDEIPGFTQEDLLDEDVFMLDIRTTVFVWVGSQSNDQEKSMAVDTAQRFVSEATDGRDPDTPIIRINAGAEPSNFTQYFIGWDASLANRNKFVDPYAAKLAAMRGGGESKEEAGHAAPAAVSSGGNFLPLSTVVAYEALRAGTGGNVDPAQKEMYMSDAEFATVMGCSKAEWVRMPKWKQQAKKKEKQLF